MYRAKKYFIINNTLIKPGEVIEHLDEDVWARLRECKAVDTEPDEVEAQIDDGRGIHEMYDNLEPESKSLKEEPTTQEVSKTSKRKRSDK